MMELPHFSFEQLSQLITSNAPPSQLFEVLSRYESDAVLMAADASADSQLLSLFYSSFFFAHLLTEQMLVLLGHVVLVTNRSWYTIDLKPAH